eukprot:4815376-Amphidinium_carterae.1
MGIMLPAMLDAVPGVLSVIVIPGTVPLLLPGPLLESLQACLDFRVKTIHWQSCHAYSEVRTLPSGHIGCNVIGDWSVFFEKVPGAEQFRRTAEHAKHIESLAISSPPPALLASSATPTQYFDLRGKEDEEQDEVSCKSYEAEWMPLQPSGSSEQPVQKQVSFATHEFGGPSCDAVNSRGGAKEQGKSKLSTGVHPGRLLTTDSMVEVDAQVGVHHGSRLPSSNGVGDARPDRVSQACCASTSWDTASPPRDCAGSTQVAGLQGSSEGGCGSVLCSPHTPSEGQCVCSVVSVQDMPGALPERERGVHWPLAVDIGDMLFEWKTLSPSEHQRMEQILRKGQPPTQLRCQFGHCPQLPWEEAAVNAIELGYTGRVWCLGFAAGPNEHTTSLVDSHTIPTGIWQGLILLERCGHAATDPSSEIQSTPSTSDANRVWSLVAEGEVGEHKLSDGSILHLHTPQRKIPNAGLDLNMDVLAYRVVLALEETAD